MYVCLCVCVCVCVCVCIYYILSKPATKPLKKIRNPPPKKNRGSTDQRARVQHCGGQYETTTGLAILVIFLTFFLYLKNVK